MRKNIRYLLNTVLAGLFMTSVAVSQITLGQLDDFSSGIAGWERGTVVNNELELVADGSGPNGKLVTFNQTQWTGDYASASVSQIAMSVTNPGDQALSMRVALGTGSNANDGTWYASTEAASVPAGGTEYMTFSLDPTVMTLVEGSADYATVLSGVVTLRILHSASPSAQGDPISATIYIDDIEALGPVGVGLKKADSGISVYPAPAGDWFAVKGDQPIHTVTVYNMTGSTEKIWENPSSNATFTVADLSSGLYIVRVETGTSSWTERLMIR
jgi:hypothetical protein